MKEPATAQNAPIPDEPKDLRITAVELCSRDPLATLLLRVSHQRIWVVT